jgi:hypothetical protein
MGCIFTLGLAFAPAAVIGAYYRSWQAGVVSAVASSGGALIGFFLFRGAETLLGSASTATDGAGSSALPGLSVGWFVGLALSVWVSRARGVASDEPLPGMWLLRTWRFSRPAAVTRPDRREIRSTARAIRMQSHARRQST